MSTPKSSKAAPSKSAGEGKVRAYHDEQTLGKAYDSRLVKRLWPFIAPQWPVLVCALVLMASLTFLNLARPRLMGNVVRAAVSSDHTTLFMRGALLAAAVVGTQIINFAQTYLLQLAGARAMADLRTHIFRFLQRLQLRYFDRTPVGRLVTRATSDVDAVGELFASGVLNAVGDLLSLFGIVIMMLLLDVQLALISFAALPIVIVITNIVRKRSREAFRDIRTRTARLNAFLNEQVQGIAVVQAYAREKKMALEFDEINRGYLEANKQSIFFEAILDAAIEMVGTLCVASILFWTGAFRFGSHAITFALLVTFVQYIKQFFEPVSLLAQRYTVLQSAMAGAERIFELLDVTELETGAVAVVNDGNVIAADEALAFDHLSFAYKAGTPVLKDVNFTVKRGQRVGLVGATGAGKSTVASLLLRLYDANQGEVRVLGQDVRTMERAELRKLFSVVPQDVFLFAGTILSNIALSEDGVSRERAEECLRQVGAVDLLSKRGLDANVVERGTNFSAGERQLISFARALYRNAPILILDEATASIDSDTESKLQGALDAVLRGRTAIVIAHRLATIRKLDRIVVFHKGEVVEDGTHSELLAKGGVYARLHALQSSGSSEAKAA